MSATTLSFFVLIVGFVTSAQANDDEQTTAQIAPSSDGIQGDYLGLVEGQKIGARVRAVGDDEFELSVYFGGLPAAGAKRGNDVKTAKGKTKGEITTFVDGTRTAKIEDGILTLFESGKAVATLKKVERNAPMPDKVEVQFTSTKVSVDCSKLVRQLCWSANGKYLFVLQTDGLLRKLELPDFRESQRVVLEGRCSDFAISSIGPVVLLDATQHAVLLDHDLKILKRLHVPGTVALTTAPKLDHAFLIGEDVIGVWNLNGSRINVIPVSEFARSAHRVKRTTAEPASVGYRLAQCTPDGRYLLTAPDHRITRFRIRRGALVLDEQGWRIGHGGTPTTMNVGGNPSRVSLVFGGGNEQAPGHPKVNYGTYVYDVTDLRVPITTIEPGAYPRAVGFDTAAGLIYGQASGKELIVFNEGGAQLGSFDLSETGRSRNESTQVFAPHPQGGRTLVLTDMNLYWCSLPKKWIKKGN